MNRSYRRHRSMRALLFSGVVHLCLIIAFTFSFYIQKPVGVEDVIEVDLLSAKDAPQRPRRLKPPPPKRLRVPQQTDPSTESNQRYLDLEASANLINETIRQSEVELLQNATKSVSDTETTLPDVMTDAQRPFNSRTTPIHESVASPFQATAGEGVESVRQRVKGDGKTGFHRLDSTGAAEIGSIGDGKGEGEGEGTGKGDSTNPFAEALENIASHIIATRELDKVNVVFVVDTSASMRDNIQEVAENLYSLTDTFDLVNIEYHLGMSEFSVRHEGQNLEVRSLLPDVAMLRRRMQQVTLSGNERALDALLDTLHRIDFHADADRFIILVTDEPATTAFTKEDIEKTREKVIKEYQLQEIRVNVLGYPEQFQKQLAETTGGLWQQIPGDFRGATSLPSTHAGNSAFIKVFRDIVTDIRRSGGQLLFSMASQFEVELEDGDIPAQKLEREFKRNGVSLSMGGSLFNNAKVWEKEEGDLWVITDYASNHTYTIRKAGDKLNVYAGIYPESWNLSENLTALTQQRGNRWLINDRRGNRMYTVRNEKDRLNVYAGGTPGASPEKGFGTVVDIVVMLDYSRSMGGKSEAIMLGLSTLIGRLDILPIKYRIGLIRFAEAKDAIKVINGAVVTQMPLNESMLKSYMEDPFGGDEHLIDAIVEGLPKVKFSPFASRFLLILTDEPTTGKYPPERALSVCQSLGVRAYVIGHPRATDFQKTLVEQTGGIFFTMPKHLNKAYPNQ